MTAVPTESMIHRRGTENVLRKSPIAAFLPGVPRFVRGRPCRNLKGAYYTSRRLWRASCIVSNQGREVSRLPVPSPTELLWVDLSRMIVVPRTAGIVKGFRTPARHRREGAHGGRRPKSLEGGNRGGSSHRRWCRSMGNLPPLLDLNCRVPDRTTVE